VFGPRYFGPYFGPTYFGPSGTATVTEPGSGGSGGGSGGGSSAPTTFLRGLRPFPERHYKTPVVHAAREVTDEDGDPVEHWPGVDGWPGDVTELRCNASQATPQTKFANQTEETVTGWVLWFSPAALAREGVTIRRGDRLTIPATYGDDVVLRAKADATDYNALGVSIMCNCEDVD
jgi:hypothetical protein